MSTQNNTNNTSNEVYTELDRLFISNDLDGKVSSIRLTKFMNMGFRFWSSVPKGYRLVKENIFTRNISNIGKTTGHGFKFIWPLVYKTMLVPTHAVTKQYKDIGARTNGGVDLKIDVNIVMHISDPAKYVTEGKYQAAQLNALIKNLLLNYVSKKNHTEITNAACKINEFSANGELTIFSKKYGIQIDKILIENVTLPEALKKAEDDAAQARARQKAADIDNQTRLRAANSDAEIIGITEKARRDQMVQSLNAIKKVLIEAGMSQQEISATLSKYMLTLNGNTSVVLGTGIDANIQAMIEANAKLGQAQAPSDGEHGRARARRP